MATKLFSELGISAEMLKAIDRMGFEQASPIQAEAIPVLLEGKDVVGQSQTGSGKTAAFAIPAIEKIDPRDRAVQALILCPTRELAVQVAEEVHKLAWFKRGIHALPIYGGQSYERQYAGLRQGSQVVIGTPGRVMDHMRRGSLRLDAVRMVVLDEADVMLNMGFREDIEFILEAVPSERQTVFFCATLPRPIQELIQRFARDPVSVHIEQKTITVPTVEQVYYEVDRRFKFELLTRLIDLHDHKLGIIFCNTKAMVDDLVDHLNAQGYSADRLHGDMNQAMRDRVMGKFRKSGLEFLVATDVAARGIDVDDVQVVFNYDLPYDVEDYVHRIGRTGRAGRSGVAISFVSGRELFQIKNIERYTRMRIQRARIPTVDEVEEARAGVVLQRVRETLASGEFRQQEHLIELLLEQGFASTDVAAALLHLLQAGEPAARGRRDEAPQERRPQRDEPRERRDEPRRRERERDREREPRQRREDVPAGERKRPARPVESPQAPKAQPAPAAPAVAAAEVPPPAAPPAAEPAPAPKPVVTLQPTEPEPLSDPSAKKPAVVPAVNSPTPAPAPKAPMAKVRPLEEPQPSRSPKHSRRTPDGQTRLHINIGKEMGVAPADVVQVIQGETGLPAKIVGTVDLRERHLFVDVAAEHANSIAAKLNRTQLKGRKLKVKIAAARSADEEAL